MVFEGSLRRVNCAQHGIVVEAVSFADPESRFTHAFEDLVGWLAQRCDKTAITQLLRINWYTVGRIIERLVARRREPIVFSELRAIGIDELSYRKGHRYLTLVTDLLKGRVVWAGEGRSAASLAAFFEQIGPEACAGIQHVAIDMSGPYKKAIEEYIPRAQLVYDHFHVVRLLSGAVDEVRREVWRSLRGTPGADAIKNTRFALLKRPWNVTPTQRESLARLQKINAPLYRAYLLKESFSEIFDRLLLPHNAARRMRDWLSWAVRSKLDPFRKVARTIKAHLDGILAFFDTGFTTGPAEGLNNKARLATRQAYGFHSAAAVLAAVSLRCSGLEIPLPHHP